jgi:hypothetical protein
MSRKGICARGLVRGVGKVRGLIIAALALTSALAVAGCSRQPPPQVAASCIDLTGHPCAESSVSQPMSLAPSHRKVTASARAARAARLAQRLRARAAREEHRQPHAKVVSATPTTTISNTPPSPPQAAATGSESRPDSKSEPGKVQEQVAVAAALAERMTAIGAAVGEGEKGRQDGRLVVVVMARPSVKVLSDLSGKMIAIDDCYAASNGRITSAMSAAGAPEVLLLEGKSTAINRLSDGEVMAAVVALASPEAAEAFPQLAGFTLFRVPLAPPR